MFEEKPIYSVWVNGTYQKYLGENGADAAESFLKEIFSGRVVTASFQERFMMLHHRAHKREEVITTWIWDKSDGAIKKEQTSGAI